MRDIRKDLVERYGAVSEELAQQRQVLNRLERELESIKYLLDLEGRRWEPTAPVQESITKVESPRVSEAIMGLLALGEEWSTETLMNAILKTVLFPPNTSARRSIHIQLVNLQKRGEITKTRSGRWKRSNAGENSLTEEASE